MDASDSSELAVPDSLYKKTTDELVRFDIRQTRAQYPHSVSITVDFKMTPLVIFIISLLSQTNLNQNLRAIMPCPELKNSETTHWFANILFAQ